MTGLGWSRRPGAAVGQPPNPPLLRENAKLLLACFIFAVVLWMYVADTDTDSGAPQPVVRELTVPLKLINAHIPVIEADATTVAVRVQGLPSLPDHPIVRAYVDLSHITTAGRHRVPVSVQSLSDPDATTTVAPEAVNVFMDTTETRELPVSFQRAKDPPPGYRPLAPVIEPERVTVTGPSSLLGKAQALVGVDLSDTTDSVDVVLPVRLTDIKDTDPRLFTIKPDRVRVYLPIQKYEYATMPVTPRLTGAPPPGYSVESIQVSPAVVTVMGLEGVIDQISSVSTVPISLNGVTTSVSKRAPLELPQGLSLRGQADSVRVRIQVAAPPPAPVIPAPAPAVVPKLAPGATVGAHP